MKYKKNFKIISSSFNSFKENIKLSFKFKINQKNMHMKKKIHCLNFLNKKRGKEEKKNK